MELRKGEKMEFLRLYLGELTGLALVLLAFLAAAAIALRYFPNRTMIRTIRNACIAAVIAIFAASLAFSIVVNRVPRGRIDHTAADQDQKAFEQRHSSQTK